MKGTGKQYHLPFNIETVRKSIKWRRGEEDGNLGEENQDFKKWGWEEYQVVGNFTQLSIYLNLFV